MQATAEQEESRILFANSGQVSIKSPFSATRHQFIHLISLPLRPYSSFAMTTQDNAASSSQFAQLLAAIQRVEANVDKKLLTMKRELKEERESSDERLVKKIRLDKPTF